uniref:AGC-kinase C-terminal domain-containing protein n=1 Tax=Panagrellus redivivus TaxID=6233 RepID=A0A7E4W7P1_PANRE
MTLLINSSPANYSDGRAGAREGMSNMAGRHDALKMRSIDSGLDESFQKVVPTLESEFDWTRLRQFETAQCGVLPHNPRLTAGY